MKTLLRDLTQSLLLAQPADPRSYILEELRSETSGPSGSSSSTNACAFLKSSRSSARDAVRELLRSAKDGLGVQAVSFFSAPKGRGRSVLGLGDAQQLSGDAFILVDSSDGRSPGEAGRSTSHCNTASDCCTDDVCQVQASSRSVACLDVCRRRGSVVLVLAIALHAEAWVPPLQASRVPQPTPALAPKEGPR